MGYIRRGIQQGLRLEFAIFCGLHEDDPRALEDPDLFKKMWFTKGSDKLIFDFIISFWIKLKSFMIQRLVHEEKAWIDDYGDWLVHEGETMDEAKATMDYAERQRLSDEAIQESERIREEERQEQERYDAEEDAMFENEHTQELEER
ncbi:hypothetical protein N7517_000877 [Penicillium concentricum]|uniref:Uncharacterized protein n=1 Tax=Penicillium concentricum TaxID=293559 RepID=A0A9W9SQT7_9EURO|nr:uncharacterized protein N7517_000877 [Penicillium concentricum]KAJ5382966.1 hypothetical protein N7517_000877 [Penicillium concentricum]